MPQTACCIAYEVYNIYMVQPQCTVTRQLYEIQTFIAFFTAVLFQISSHKAFLLYDIYAGISLHA